MAGCLMDSVGGGNNRRIHSKLCHQTSWVGCSGGFFLIARWRYYKLLVLTSTKYIGNCIIVRQKDAEEVSLLARF